MILGGGITTPSPVALTVQSVASVAIAVAAAWQLRKGFPTWISAAGCMLALLALTLVLLQLVPMSPEMWTALPRRTLIAETYEAAGLPLPWRPLNLIPAEGYESLLAMLPAIAGYLAALTLGARNTIVLVAVILGCALLGVLLALMQKFGGPANAIYFYDKPAGVAVGTFSNRNFLGAQLFTAVPFVAAFAVGATERWHIRPWIATAFAVIYTGVLLAGLAAVGSRGGILLAMLAVFLTFAFVFRWHRFAHAGAAVLASLAAFFLISQASMVGILRLVERDPLDDFRSTMFRVSVEGATAFFPAGSGFGSFAPAYQMFERPADIVDNYVNHVHNDWLETVFSGGLPALVLIVAFLVLLVIAAARLVRFGMFSNSGSFHRAAGVAVVLFLLHAMVDFSLRTPALLSIFAVCLGLLTLPGAGLQGRGSSAPNTPVPRAPLPREQSPRPFVPGTFGNRRKPAGEPQA